MTVAVLGLVCRWCGHSRLEYRDGRLRCLDCRDEIQLQQREALGTTSGRALAAEPSSGPGGESPSPCSALGPVAKARREAPPGRSVCLLPRPGEGGRR